jgi:GNAT superfamily N-acetyltransferase
LLRTGETISVRPVEAGDLPALEVMHAHMSADSLRHRFFGTGRDLAHRYLEHLTHAPDTIALVAVAGRSVCGLGTAEPLGDGRAEVAFVVDETSHGRGIGTLLLEAVAREAATRGLSQLVAEVLTENHEMLDVFAHAGFAVSSRRIADTVCVVMETESTENQRAAARARWEIAAAHAPSVPGVALASGGPSPDGTSCPPQPAQAQVKSSS